MLIGQKRKKHYTEFLKNYLPKDIDIYVEPFGGTFNMSTYLENRPNILIYNDIHDYGFDIDADTILHKDYKEVIEEFDSESTVFYLDPPYYKKEFLYNLDSFPHEELKSTLDNIKGKFFLSYDDCKYIRDLYKDYKIIKYEGDIHYLKYEIIITNS